MESLQADKPYPFIQALYKDTKTLGGVARGVEAALNEAGALSRIPLVRGGKKFLGALPSPRTLVRVRCMVQDIYGTELYDSSPGASSCGKEGVGTYTNAFGGDVFFLKEEGAGKSVLGDRLVLACVNIPGESSWVCDLASAGCGGGSSSDDTAMCDDSDEPGAEKKRMKMDIDAVVHELPAFIVKVYVADTFETFRVNQTYEFVGVLDYSVDEKESGMEVDSATDAFYKSVVAKNPPRSVVPRIVSIPRAATVCSYLFVFFLLFSTP